MPICCYNVIRRPAGASNGSNSISLPQYPTLVHLILSRVCFPSAGSDHFKTWPDLLCMQVYHKSITIASSATDSHLIKNFPDFIQTENLLPCLQNPIILPYTNPLRFSPNCHILYWGMISVISSCFRICRLFIQIFEVNFSCALSKHGRRVLIKILDWPFREI